MKNKTFFLTVVLLAIICVSVFAQSLQNHLFLSEEDLFDACVGRDELIPNTVLGRLNESGLNLVSHYIEQKPRSEIRDANLRNIRMYQQVYTGFNPYWNIQKSQLLGGWWMNSYPNPSHIAEMTINNDNTIEVNDSLFEGVYRGTYTVEDGFLKVTITEIRDMNSYRWYVLQGEDVFRTWLPILLYEPFMDGGPYAYRIQLGYTTWYGYGDF